jgi:hypothetical protein
MKRIVGDFWVARALKSACFRSVGQVWVVSAGLGAISPQNPLA